MPLAARIEDFNQVLANPGTELYGQAHDAVRNASSLSDALTQAAASMEAFSAYPASEVSEGETVLGRVAEDEDRAVLNALRNAFGRGLVIELAWEQLPGGQAVRARHAEKTRDGATRLVVTVSSPHGSTVS